MDILDKIIAEKREEVARRKKSMPQQQLEQTSLYGATVRSLSASIRAHAPAAIIAEFKRRSPSRGDIYGHAKAAEVAHGYAKAVCAAISVLTDQTFFGGSTQDLIDVRNVVPVPVLRKEFIIDAYQLVEAKSIGADAVLLIAEVLSRAEIEQLTHQAHELGLEVLLELHGSEQVDKLIDEVDLVGINNRNLRTFQVDVDASIRLVESLQGPWLKISESGLSDPAVAARLSQSGFDGFLIGESFMKTHDPGTACSAFIRAVKELCGVVR